MLYMWTRNYYDHVSSCGLNVKHLCCLCTTVTELTYTSLPWKSFFTHKTYLRKCYMLPYTESDCETMPWVWVWYHVHCLTLKAAHSLYVWCTHSYSFSVVYQIQSSRWQWELNGQILSLRYNHSYAIHGKKVTRSGASMALQSARQHVNHILASLHAILVRLRIFSDLEDTRCWDGHIIQWSELHNYTRHLNSYCLLRCRCNLALD